MHVQFQKGQDFFFFAVALNLDLGSA